MRVARDQMRELSVEQREGRGTGAPSECSVHGTGGQLYEHAARDERLDQLGTMLNLPISLRVREHRCDPRSQKPEEAVTDIERPADVWRLDEEIAAVPCEREAGQLVLRPVELGEVELAAGDKSERVADRALHLGQRRFHLFRCGPIVVADVRRGCQHGDPSADASRQIAIASSRSAAPSSSPGRTWLWRSITPAPDRR